MFFSRLLACMTAVFILIGSGVLYDSLAVDADLLEGAAARVQDVAMEIGEWKAQRVPEKDIDQRAFASAGARGYWVRNYHHERTKSSLLVILMCGRAGKMSVHTPDVCYQGAGFEMLEQPSICSIKNELMEELGRFWTGEFTKRMQGPSNLRLHWAWSAGKTWEAAANPRWQYRGEPYLYKLYLSRDYSGPAARIGAPDPAVEFLRNLLPELHRALGTEGT